MEAKQGGDIKSPLQRKEGAMYCAPTTEKTGLGVEGGLDVGDAVAVEAGGGDGLGEDDADGDEKGAGAGSVGDGDFDARAFGELTALPSVPIDFYPSADVLADVICANFPRSVVSNDSRKTREQIREQ